MNFIDICSGIGGFRSALENNSHECLAFAEIDEFAKQSYRAIYDTDGEEDLDDITAITDEHFRLYRGRCEIITAGFPCQSFSIAGKRAGFEDTRGTIFFHIARAIKEIQPSYVLLENVKGLLSHAEQLALLKQFRKLIDYKLTLHQGSSMYREYRSKLDQLGVK